MGDTQVKKARTKAAVMQWFVLTCLLIAIVIAMLINFSVKSSRSVANDVNMTLVDDAKEYAMRVNNELVKMSDAGKPIGYLMKGYISSNKRFMVEMAEALCLNTAAYEVVYYPRGEKGLLHNGTQVEITEMPYFSQIEKAVRDIEKDESENVAVRYINVGNDGLEAGRKAIIAIVSVDGKPDGDKLLMYYPAETLCRLFDGIRYGGGTFFAIVEPNGSVIEKAGVETVFLADDNIWSGLKDVPAYKESVARAMVRMESKITGSFQAKIGGESRTCIYAPVGINDWSMVIGVNQSYVDDVRTREWRNTKNMIYQLVAAILVFFGLVMVMNIINKIKSGQESRKLEEKADTDLLTSLNNKLATERKIKEYMGEHPQEQGLLFVLDIDNFKKINDTLGHAFGDEVLRTLGHSIGSIFRASDIIGRTGGDEFTIFLKNLSDAALEKEAAKLGDFFKDFQAGEYVKYAATASIGAAVFPRDGKDFETLYKAADTALYVAKKRGKSQLAFYGDEGSKSEGLKRVETESRVHE